MYEKIKELDDLRKQGLLSDEEFNAEKKKILEGDKEEKKSNVNNSTNISMNNNKLAYIILAILLGNFGVHKFVSGNTGAGILYLVFFWTGIPGIIGVIEGVLAIFKENGEWDQMGM